MGGGEWERRSPATAVNWWGVSPPARNVGPPQAPTVRGTTGGASRRAYGWHLRCRRAGARRRVLRMRRVRVPPLRAHRALPQRDADSESSVKRERGEYREVRGGEGAGTHVVAAGRYELTVVIAADVRKRWAATSRGDCQRRRHQGLEGRDCRGGPTRPLPLPPPPTPRALGCSGRPAGEQRWIL